MVRAGAGTDDEPIPKRGRRSFLRTTGLVAASIGAVPVGGRGGTSESDRLTRAWNRSIGMNDDFKGMRAGDGFLVALRSDRIEGFERATGEPVWHHPMASPTYDAAIHGNRLHVQHDHRVRALDLGGTVVWGYDHGDTRDVRMGFRGPRGFFGDRRELSGVALEDGTVEWTVSSGPTVPRATLEDALVVEQPSTDTYGVRDPETGRERWAYRSGQSTSTTAFVGERHLFVHDRSRLIALSLVDGERAWAVAYGSSPPESVVERGGLAVVVGDGTLQALEAEAGRVLRAWSLDSRATPIAKSETLVFYATKSRLYAVEPTGDLAFTREVATPTGRRAFGSRGTSLDGDLVFANGPAVEILNDEGRVLDAAGLDGSVFSLAVDRDAVFTLAGSTLHGIALDGPIERGIPARKPTSTRTPSRTSTRTPSRTSTPTETPTAAPETTGSAEAGDTAIGGNTTPSDFESLALLVVGSLGLAYLLRDHKRRQDE